MELLPEHLAIPSRAVFQRVEAVVALLAASVCKEQSQHDLLPSDKLRLHSRATIEKQAHAEVFRSYIEIYKTKSIAN